MKLLLLITLLLLSSCTLPSVKRPRRFLPPKPDYISVRAKHMNCVKDLIKTDVEPAIANTICIDIFRIRF